MKHIKIVLVLTMILLLALGMTSCGINSDTTTIPEESGVNTEEEHTDNIKNGDDSSNNNDNTEVAEEKPFEVSQEVIDSITAETSEFAGPIDDVTWYYKDSVLVLRGEGSVEVSDIKALSNTRYIYVDDGITSFIIRGGENGASIETIRLPDTIQILQIIHQKLQM